MGVLYLDFDYTIAHPKEVFRGLTYGQWVGVWYNNLMSDYPDIFYREGKSIAFLRGNVEYAYGKQEDPENPQNRIFSSMTKEQKITIQDDTAVFIPVISTMLVLGDDSQGKVMNDELSLRYAARRDTVNGGPVGAQIVKRNLGTGAVKRLVPNELDEYYIETPLFPLLVSPSSSIRKTIEEPLEPGPYQALVAGIFVIIYDIEPGKYRIAFYGRGVGRYTTRSVYDIDVLEGNSKLQDISDPNISIFKKGEDNPMDFVKQVK